MNDMSSMTFQVAFVSCPIGTVSRSCAQDIYLWHGLTVQVIQAIVPNLKAVVQLSLTSIALHEITEAWAEKNCRYIERSQGTGCSWLQTLLHVYSGKEVRHKELQCLRQHHVEEIVAMPCCPYGDFVTYRGRWLNDMFLNSDAAKRHPELILWKLHKPGEMGVGTECTPVHFQLNDFALRGAQRTGSRRDYEVGDIFDRAYHIRQLVVTDSGEYVVTSHAYEATDHDDVTHSVVCIWSVESKKVVQFIATDDLDAMPHGCPVIESIVGYDRNCLVLVFTNGRLPPDEWRKAHLYTWNIQRECASQKLGLEQIEQCISLPKDSYDGLELVEMVRLKRGKFANNVAVLHWGYLSIVNVDERIVLEQFICELTPESVPSVEENEVHIWFQRHNGCVMNYYSLPVGVDGIDDKEFLRTIREFDGHRLIMQEWYPGNAVLARMDPITPSCCFGEHCTRLAVGSVRPTQVTKMKHYIALNTVLADGRIVTVCMESQDTSNLVRPTDSRQFVYMWY